MQITMRAARTGATLICEWKLRHKPYLGQNILGTFLLEVQTALAKEKNAIGRSWLIWTTRSRITVGSAAEMAAFDAAVIRLNL
ncbi:MAG: hypothetical protein Q7U11_13490 [Phenylobacterium sp.]|nr:hypothetical protein [Phenylobacterium sp.]